MHCLFICSAKIIKIDEAQEINFKYTREGILYKKESEGVLQVQVDIQTRYLICHMVHGASYSVPSLIKIFNSGV